MQNVKFEQNFSSLFSASVSDSAWLEFKVREGVSRDRGISRTLHVTLMLSGLSGFIPYV